MRESDRRTVLAMENQAMLEAAIAVARQRLPLASESSYEVIETPISLVKDVQHDSATYRIQYFFAMAKFKKQYIDGILIGWEFAGLIMP